MIKTPNGIPKKPLLLSHTEYTFRYNVVTASIYYISKNIKKSKSLVDILYSKVSDGLCLTVLMNFKRH